MTGTTRTNYKGEPIRDGEHGRRCGSANCDRCGTGYYKPAARRAVRHTQQTQIRQSTEGLA